MESSVAMEPQLQIAQEIEKLRQQFPETQALYREVCSLLFFRHGITPTANKLYQLVKRGSMSAPAEALARFWENLREKSRVRIEHPDLPPDLAAMAGEVIGGLWQRARSSAEESFSAAVAAERAAVAEAQAQAVTELARAEAAAHALFQLQAEFSATLTRMQDLENTLAREQGLREATERQMASAIAQRREMQESLAAARRDFESQSTAERQAMQEKEGQLRLVIERLEAEARGERERSAEALYALEESCRAASADSTRHAATVQSFQREISQLQQRLGMAEGTVAEMRVARDFLQRQIDAAKLQGRPASARPRGRIVRTAR